MNWCSFEVWSDLAGLASAVAMVIPAWKADSLAGFINKIDPRANNKSGLPLPAHSPEASAAQAPRGDPNAGKVVAKLREMADGWNAFDRWLLRIGVVLLISSFALKMAHHASW